MEKILIFTVSTGGGHNTASKVIANKLKENNVECLITDPFKDTGFTGKLIDTLLCKGYEKSAKYTPKAYGGLYGVTNIKPARKAMDANLMINYMEKNILKIINEYKPTKILGTHPFPMIACSNLKATREITIPLYTVITDYTIHSAHVAENIDYYIVPDVELKETLIEKGVKPEAIFPYGIPANIPSYTDIEISNWKKERNILNKFTILIMGGSIGAGSISNTFSKVLNLDLDIQIVVICGNNIHLKKKITNIYNESKTTKNVIIEGFTKEIGKYMQISNCTITKPGGLTITECVQKNLPMIVPYYIPGQEKANLHYLLNNGLAIVPNKQSDIDNIIKTLYKNPYKLERIRNSMEFSKKKNTLDNIFDLLCNKID